jgi:hypothetical protein
VRVYTPGFGFAIETYICRNRKNVTCDKHGAKKDQELERLTFYGFPKVLDFLKKELFGVRSPQGFGKSNIDFGGNYLQLMLSVLKLVAQVKESSLVEGALLSTAQEELATVSYEIGQASGPADEPCTGGPQSQAVIGNQDANKCRIHRGKVTK